ncbi:MAG: hypothetical protein M1812_005714 [Candelaria pacifica]|nr:MAG: hypothetical protein M1812_005714 [Candelaria pacifica]
MRGYWKVPLLAAVLYGSQSLVNSSPVPADSLATSALAIRDDGPPLIGPSKDYKGLAKKGKEVDDELLKAIKDKVKDVVLKPLEDNYEERDPEVSKIITGAEDLVDDFKEIGLDYEKAKYSSVRVFSKEGPVNKGVVVAGKYYDQNGVIVGEDRFSANDKNAKDKKMKSSDIVFLIWKMFAGHRNKNGSLKRGMTDDVDKLMDFIGRNILSRSTVETMVKAQENTKQPKDHVGHFKRDSKDAELEAFYALLGTDSLSSYNYMLKDHHEALGNKRIKEIFTYPRTYDSAKNPKGRKKISMVAKFEVYKPT